MNENTHLNLIGLVGKKRVGKDAIAQTLVREYDFTQLAFADLLKDAAIALNPIVGVDDDLMFLVRLATAVHGRGWEGTKAKYPEARSILQRLGTDVVRAVDEDFWVKALEARLLATDGPVVVSDVRFENEAALIRRYGGTVVRVTRHDAYRDLDDHASENVDGIPFDTEVVNEGTLADLEQAVRSLIHS